MSIFVRISDIITANFNELIEKYENPEQMLKQAIREMESAISSARPDVARAMASEKTVAKELAANEKQATLWKERATTAVRSGDDELAKKALSRAKEFEKIIAALRDQLNASTEASQSLRRQYEAMESKLADAQRRLATLVARNRAAEIRTRLATAECQLDIPGDAFAKFDRMAKKVENAEAEAEAYSELAQAKASLNPAPIKEFEADEIDLEVEAELASLKKSMRQ